MKADIDTRIGDADLQAAYIDAAAAALRLSIGPWRPGVLRYFALACEMNAIVEGCAVDVHDESGERFVPVEPMTK